MLFSELPLTIRQVYKPERVTSVRHGSLDQFYVNLISGKTDRWVYNPQTGWTRDEKPASGYVVSGKRK